MTPFASASPSATASSSASASLSATPPVLLITSYPPKDTTHSTKVSGLAAFAKNKVHAMKHTRFIILSDIHDSTETYRDGESLVIPCWKRNSLGLYFNLINKLVFYRKQTNTLLVEFEFSIFGNQYVTGFMPALLIIARLLGYRVNMVLHQVMLNFSEFAPHLGIEPHSLKDQVFSFLLSLYCRFLCLPCKTIFVHDEIHRQRLSTYANKEKIITVPLGVETEHVPSDLEERIEQAHTMRVSRHTFSIMTFGFIAWYKGTDWLVEKFKVYLAEHPENQYNFSLTIAGGQSPTQKASPAYQTFYRSVEQSVASLGKNATLTGYVDENAIADCFINADLIIFPYRVLMSSSGPLALALSYERPFLLSENITPYTLTEDFALSLKENGLTSEDVSFPMEQGRLFEKVTYLAKHPDKLDRLTDLSKELKSQRSWENIGKMYEKVISPVDVTQ